MLEWRGVRANCTIERGIDDYNTRKIIIVVPYVLTTLKIWTVQADFIVKKSKMIDLDYTLIWTSR